MAIGQHGEQHGHQGGRGTEAGNQCCPARRADWGLLWTGASGAWGTDGAVGTPPAPSAPSPQPLPGLIGQGLLQVFASLVVVVMVWRAVVRGPAPLGGDALHVLRMLGASNSTANPTTPPRHHRVGGCPTANTANTPT